MSQTGWNQLTQECPEILQLMAELPLHMRPGMINAVYDAKRGVELNALSDWLVNWLCFCNARDTELCANVYSLLEKLGKVSSTWRIKN